MENYTKYALKAEEEIKQVLAPIDDLFVIACGKCFKEFDTPVEPEPDQLLDESVIIATSSSGLLMTEIQTAVERFPERCLIGHPINPVFLVPLVEIVPGKQTKPEYMVTTRAFYESIGKVPVCVTH